MARPASEIVKADVTRRVPARDRFVTAASRSSSAATRALDSMYVTCVVVVPGRDRIATADGARRLALLALATVCVDEFSRRAARQPDVGPPLEGITGLERRPQRP